MATTYKSNDLLFAHRARPVHDGKLNSRSGSILIPSGTLLASGDIIRLFRVHPKMILPTRVIVDCSITLDGHATAASRLLTATLGYLKSADRNGTNLSFLASATTTAATESSALLLAAATAPIVNTTTTSFANAGAAGCLTTTAGSTVIFNPVVASQVSRGFDANVMDVALSITASSSTATTADCNLMVTLEYASEAVAATARGYLYKYAYNSSGVSS